MPRGGDFRAQEASQVVLPTCSNLFPGGKVEQQEEASDHCIILDHFINRKKPPTKNSIKLRKFLHSFISRSYEEVNTNSFLQFISLKHKIPLKAITRPTKPQTGYVLPPLPRNRPTSAKSGSTNSTAPPFHLWAPPLTPKIKSNPTRKRLSSENLSIQLIFSSRGRNVSKRDPTRDSTCYRKGNCLSL